jgi:hypothetical protein
VYYCFYLVSGRVFFFSIFLFSIFSFIFSDTMYDRFVYPFYGPYGLLGNILLYFDYPTSTRRHGNFAGVHTLLRIILSSNSAVLINIITGVSPPHFDFVVYYVLCQC